jgi:anti-anti-sigma factor
VSQQTPERAAGILEIERHGDTVIVTPLTDLDEMGFQQIESASKEVRDLLVGPSVKNVLLDLHKTDYFGSTALGFFVTLWTRVRNRNGQMAFCCISAHEREILQITRLDQVWSIYTARGEALAAFQG